MTNKYLAHHGIKGQRWGIRRYQNEDGTLTKEGQRRIENVDSDQITISKQKQQIKKMVKIGIVATALAVIGTAWYMKNKNGAMKTPLSKVSKTTRKKAAEAVKYLKPDEIIWNTASGTGSTGFRPGSTGFRPARTISNLLALPAPNGR